MKVSESLSRDILRLIIWFPFRWLVSAIPVRWGLFLMKAAGDLHFRAGGGKRAFLQKKIRDVLQVNEAKAKDAVKRILENHYLDRLHIFLYPRLRCVEDVKPFVSFENIGELEKELERGKGALIVQPHFGPVQITLMALGVHGFNPIQIGLPSDEGLSNIGKNVAFKYRLKYEGMLPPIVAADKYLGAVYKHLKKGGVVLTTGDGAGGGVYLGEHRKMSLLGGERMVPLGPASMAIKTGASFVPTFIINEGFDKFRIVFEKPIEGIYGDYEKDRVYITERFISVAEEYIRKYPYCWHFWDEI